MNSINEQPLSVVFIPGFMLDESLWDEIIKELPTNWQLVKANLLTGQTIAEIAQHIAQQAPSQFILIGFSLGGYIARALAAQFPEKVLALVLIASSLRPDTVEQKERKLAAIKASSPENFRGLSSLAIAKTLHPAQAKNKTLINRIQNMGRKMGYNTFVKQSLLNRDDYHTATIKCPTLVIAGAEDTTRTMQETTELYQQIPHAMLKVIANTGHMIPLEQPKELVTTLLQWLNSIKL